MSEKLGYQLTAPQGGIENPYLSNGVYRITNKWFPYSYSLAEPSLLGVIIRNGSNKPSRVINGALITSYSDDYYHRVHILPNQIELGNIASSQEFKCYVWNAHFTKKRLTAINGISEGLILEGKQAPYTFNPLEEQTYKLTVTPDGASTIDDALTWNFNDETPSITITGDRIVAFSFMPTWTDGITERLEWSTNILTSDSGVEQRSALYLTPRQYFKTSFIFHQNERQYFNNMMSWSARVWAIPLWHYVQFINKPLAKNDTVIYCTTKDIEFTESGLILLWRETFSYEIAEVTTVNTDSLVLKRPLQSGWDTSTRIYPAKAALFNKQPELSRKTDQLQTASIEFRLNENSPYNAIAPVTNYLGYPVLALRPNESEDLTNSYQRLLSTLDNAMSLPKVTDTSGFSFLLQSYRWLGMGREERRQFRELIYYLNGKQKVLWIPSHADDLTIADIISPTEPILTIKACGYTRFASNDTDKKHIAIYLTDGTVFYRTITSSESLGTTERIAIDSPLGQQVYPEQVDYISFMRLCRSNGDTVEINHLVDSEGVATSQLTFRRVRDNEL